MGDLDGLRALQRQVHKTAREKGWWEYPRAFGTLIALAHSELSEALEAWRTGPSIDGTPATIPAPFYTGEDYTPEGWAVELADCVIRILDICEHYGVNLADTLTIKALYNQWRPHRHGGKRE